MLEKGGPVVWGLTSFLDLGVKNVLSENYTRRPTYMNEYDIDNSVKTAQYHKPPK